MAMGDIDGDGRDELAIGRNSGPNMRWVMLDDASTLYRRIDSGGNDWGNGRGVSAMAMGDIDGDGFTSEQDPDCKKFNQIGYVPYEAGPQCVDGFDNDGDGLIDGADPDCR